MSLELKLKYPAFKALHYGLVLKTGDRKIVIPPASFVVGPAIAATPAELKNALREWHSHPEQSEIALKESYLVTVRRDQQGNPVRKRANIWELAFNEFYYAFREKVRGQEGTIKLVSTGGKKNFSTPKDIEARRSRPHVGNIVLTGIVRGKSDARRAEGKRFYSVSIDGAFETSLLPLSDLSCDCPAGFTAASKGGYSGQQILDSHIAALLDYVAAHPGEVKNLSRIKEDRKHLAVLLPFTIDSHTRIDQLVDRYFNNTNLAEISRRLSADTEIYHPQMLEALEQGQARFEVIPQQQNMPMSPSVRQLWRDTEKALSDVGFGIDGYVWERSGTPYESVAVNYRHEDGREARIVFNKEFPPVIIWRTPRDHAQLHLQGKANSPVHPFTLLFKPGSSHDDSTQRTTESDIRVPTFELPPALVPEYQKTIETYFDGGLRGLATHLRRNAKQLSVNLKNPGIKQLLS